MFKLNKKVIIITSILLLLILGIGSYFSLKAFGGIEKVINSKKDSGWDILTKNGYKTVICKKDLLNPVNVTIASINGKDQSAFVFYTNLTRDNIFNDFKTNDYQGASGNTTFSETDINKVAKLYEQKGCDFFRKDGTYEGVNFTYNPPITKEQAEAQEQQNLESQKQYEQKLQDNKDKGLLNFQLFLSECVTATKPKMVGPLTNEEYDRCKSEYDTYLEQKGVTYDSLNP